VVLVVLVSFLELIYTLSICEMIHLYSFPVVPLIMKHLSSLKYEMVHSHHFNPSIIKFPSRFNVKPFTFHVTSLRLTCRKMSSLSMKWFTSPYLLRLIYLAGLKMTREYYLAVQFRKYWY
jgi:hypothetical protein